MAGSKLAMGKDMNIEGYCLFCCLPSAKDPKE